MMADEFGGEIPVGPFALIGDDSIGRGIVETLGAPLPAVLMRNHGPSPWADARAAVKAAVMCEEVARTVHIARQLGEPMPIPQSDIDALYDRYQNVYGQDARPRTRGADDATDAARSGFSPAARGSTAPETLAPGRGAVAADRRSARRPALRSRCVWQPVLTDAGRDPPACPGGQRRRRRASA